MGHGIMKGRTTNKRYVRSISSLSKARLVLGVIFSITGLILIIISLLGIKT